MLFASIFLAMGIVLASCYTVTPPVVPPPPPAPDLQTGKNDAGLIGDPFTVNGVIWWHTSDDFRADYVRLLAKYRGQLKSPPKDASEGWNLTAPISASLAALDIMKSLRQLDLPKAP